MEQLHTISNKTNSIDYLKTAYLAVCSQPCEMECSFSLILKQMFFVWFFFSRAAVLLHIFWEVEQAKWSKRWTFSKFHSIILEAV